MTQRFGDRYCLSGQAAQPGAGIAVSVTGKKLGQRHQHLLGRLHDWSLFSDRPMRSLATAANQDGRLEVFALDSAGALWHLYQTGANKRFG